MFFINGKENIPKNPANPNAAFENIPYQRFKICAQNIALSRIFLKIQVHYS